MGKFTEHKLLSLRNLAKHLPKVVFDNLTPKVALPSVLFCNNHIQWAWIFFQSSSNQSRMHLFFIKRLTIQVERYPSAKVGSGRSFKTVMEIRGTHGNYRCIYSLGYTSGETLGVYAHASGSIWHHALENTGGEVPGEVYMSISQVERICRWTLKSQIGKSGACSNKHDQLYTFYLMRLQFL